MRLAEWFSTRSIPAEEKSYISQLISGKASFGERAARRLERDYGLGDRFLDEAPDNLTLEPTVTAVHPDDEKRDDLVYVPESRIEFAAGNGRTAVYELIEDQEPATYRLSWFQKYGINPDRVRRFRVSGDSMEPFLYPRDTILVNQDETNIIEGKLYAIRYGDELRVKFLSRRLDGTMILRSANPLYKDEEVSPELANEHITVIGRVRDRSGTGGL